MSKPPEYLNALQELKWKLCTTTTLQKIRRYFQEMAAKVTLLPEEWESWMRDETRSYDYVMTELDITCREAMKARMEEVQSQALSCFYQKSFLEFTDKVPENVHYIHSIMEWYSFNFEKEYFTLASKGNLNKVLCYPHEQLKYFLNECDMLSLQPIPRDIMHKYQKALELSEVIKGKPLEKYVYLLPDIDFAIESIEWKLGKNPLSEHCWKFYMKFLKDRDKAKELLNVYSRYCRLFVSDLEMRKEYLDKIKELDESSVDVTKWWIDYIGIEKHFGSLEVAQNLIEAVKSKPLNSADSRMSKFIKNLSLSRVDIPRTSFSNVKILFSKGLNEPLTNILQYINKAFLEMPSMTLPPHFKNLAINQTFSLPYPLANYIFKSANNNLKHTLIQTCQYLFYKEKQIFCHKLSICNWWEKSPKFCQRSFYLNPKDLPDIKFKNYCITNTLKIKPKIEEFPNHNLIFSQIIKAMKFDIKFIHVSYQTMTLDEINLLPCHQIKVSHLVNVTVFNENGEILCVEDLMGLFPYATTKQIVTDKFDEHSSVNFSKIKLPVKLNVLMMHIIPDNFDPNDFIQFLKKNVGKCSRVFFSFNPNVGIEISNIFLDAVKSFYNYKFGV